MEVALAAITIATAVKDLVELAEKIHASFEKVSDNLRKAQALASDIKQTINELKAFCEQHGAALENDKGLLEALLELIDKFRGFDSVILPLRASPSATLRRLTRFKHRFKALRNGDRIEASIQELKEEVEKCQRNFMRMSLIRTELNTIETHGSTNEVLRMVKQVSDKLVTHSTVLFTLHSSASSSSKNMITASNRNIISSAETSTSTVMWQTPSPTQEQINRDNFLRDQTNAIADSLSKLSTLDATYSIRRKKGHASQFTFKLAHTLWPTCHNTDSFHRRVVKQALSFRETFENGPTSTSIQKGAHDLADLAYNLWAVGMYDEAVKMGNWAVSLYWTLIKVDEAIYTPHLVANLHSLSAYKTQVGDHDGALDSIEKAATISKGLQTPTARIETRLQHGYILFLYAMSVSRVKKDHKRAIELAEQSVELMEDINSINLLPPSHVKVDGIVQVSRPFLKRLYQVSPSGLAIVQYARALRELSNCLTADGQHQRALDAKLRALPIFYDMPSLLKGNMDTELAGVLYELVDQQCNFLLPTEKVLEYAEDCVKIYRRHAELNPSRYGRYLCDALWRKGTILDTLKHHSDALEVWKEIANIAQQIMQDRAYYACALNQVSQSFRRLKRREEALSVQELLVLTYEAINDTTTELQACAYYNLCVDYRRTKRFSEAVDTAKKAVKQYRELNCIEPDHWTSQIGQALILLTKSLVAVGDHEAALDAAHESMQIFERHINTDPKCVEFYYLSLKVNMRLAITVNNERGTNMEDVLHHVRQLALDFPQEASQVALFRAELYYAWNLNRLDHIQDARRHIEELIAKWEVEDYLYVNKEAFTDLHMRALITYTSTLVNQGHVDLALMPIRQAADIGKPLAATSPELAGQTVRAMYKHAELLVELGRSNEGLVVAEVALIFSRETEVEDASHLVGVLHVVGLAAHRTQAYGRVVEVSQEAVSICRSADSDFLEHFYTEQHAFCPLSSCLQLLSSGHANSGNLKLGLHYAQEAVDDAKAFASKIWIPHTDQQQYYIEANGQLGAMYLANGKIDAAREAFEETRAYYTERVKVRPGLSGSLVSTLHRLGIIYCSKGRHDEGHAAAQEAKTYLHHLAQVLPGLHEQVHIAMRHELTTPSLQVLNRMKETLSCNHQADLSF